MSRVQQDKYMVVTIYDRDEIGIVFHATLKAARADYNRQVQGGYEAYVARVMK